MSRYAEVGKDVASTITELAQPVQDAAVGAVNLMVETVSGYVPEVQLPAAVPTLREHDIKLIHMRHEQSTAYAADGWARTTATPGVCCVTAGCGLTNAVTGLCVAGLTGSAVVCISGQHPTTEDSIGSFQEAYGAD